MRAAAGGGINGAGATSTTTLSGTSRVVLADDVALAAGTSPTGAPGPILIQAWSELTGDDTATLTTGGLLQGAGVASRYSAEIDNAVTLGLRSTVTSFGVINIGTYTTADVRTNAYVSTYGVAGVGVADADVTLKTRNNVGIGANAALLGLGDVNVTAGRDGSGLRTNSLTGRATALGYVRGLIAVPDADASTDLQNHARVEVASGASIASAQNVTLGGYDGLLNAYADGTGYGYQLFFIPVANDSSSPGASSSSTLVMNGTATAGIYNTQRIEIGCGTNAAQQCGVNDTPTIRFVSGAPVTANINGAFNAVSYINALYDSSVAGTLISGVSGSPVTAVRLSQLYAAGGNVYVGGRTVSGNGTLTARGGPSITVINRSNAYLVLDGGAYIPESTGGQIVGASGGLTRNSNPDATPVITIDNAYAGALDASGNGPALLIAGDVTNLAGVVSINNTLGSFGFSGQRIDALQFNVTVPNGAVAVSSNGPNGLYNAGASPQAEYGSYIVYPGGGQGTTLNPNEAIYAAANALAAAAGVSDVNYFLYGTQADGQTRNWSLQFFGNCAGYIADSGYNCATGYNIGNDIRMTLIPTVPTYRTSNPTAQGGGTQIYGAQVAIKATTININASIEAGRITNWSGTIAANIGTILSSVRQGYLDAGTTSASFASIFGGGWANPGAAPVVYDVVNHRLILNDVNASSGGGSVLLDGQIISTNTIGRIKVNGGFGDVSLVNNSGLDLVTSRINTGTAAGVNASVSKITIVDRLITSGPNTTVYAYTPGSGIAVYKTNNGAQPVLGTTTPVAFVSGDTTSYTPVAGTRYEWTQQALLERVGLTVANRNQRDVVSYWVYSSGTSSNPWVYVDAQSPSTNPGADPRYWWSRSAQSPSATPVSGRLTNDTSLTHVGLTQTITGGHLDFINNSASYGGCQGGSPNYCDRGFVGQPGASQAVWDYNYATRAFVQVTASVKADNPFAISFAGNAAGRVNIQTNGGLLLQGNVVNPSGSTTLNATGGAITQAANVSILSKDLTLNARDAIGTATQAITTTLTSGASLAAATGSGGIHLDITGGARITTLRADGNPNAYGDVVVRATGGLEAAAQSGANIIGRNITLSSETGGVGSLTTAMKLRAMATQLPNGSFVDGVVNVSALGDVGISQLAGDLRVGEIRSDAGDVRIEVSNGRLVSATGQTSAQALSAEQLSKVSRALKLTANDGAATAAQASIATFEAQVTQAYGLYSALIRNGSVDGNGAFRLNDAAIPLYQAFADAALGRTASAQEVKTYAAGRYAAYAGAFEIAYGAGWATQARFQPATLQSNYSFRTTDADAASGIANRIAGDAVWTDRQLVSAINQSALQPTSGSVGNGTALVVGRDVTLVTAGSIGSLAADMQVSLDSIRNGTISDAELAALSVATTPGSVKIMGRRQDGSLVEVTDLGNVPNGVTLARVDVSQTAPLFINATGTFNASAQGDIYVQATANVPSSSTPRSAGATLNLGAISATGTVNLQAPLAITVATQADGTTPRSPVQIQTGGDLVLVAGGGGIGSTATPDLPDRWPAGLRLGRRGRRGAGRPGRQRRDRPHLRLRQRLAHGARRLHPRLSAGRRHRRDLDPSRCERRCRLCLRRARPSIRIDRLRHRTDRRTRLARGADHRRPGPQHAAARRPRRHGRCRRHRRWRHRGPRQPALEPRRRIPDRRHDRDGGRLADQRHRCGDPGFGRHDHPRQGREHARGPGRRRLDRADRGRHDPRQWRHRNPARRQRERRRRHAAGRRRHRQRPCSARARRPEPVGPQPQRPSEPGRDDGAGHESGRRCGIDHADGERHAGRGCRHQRRRDCALGRQRNADDRHAAGGRRQHAGRLGARHDHQRDDNRGRPRHHLHQRRHHGGDARCKPRRHAERRNGRSVTTSLTAGRTANAPQAAARSASPRCWPAPTRPSTPAAPSPSARHRHDGDLASTANPATRTPRSRRRRSASPATRRWTRPPTNAARPSRHLAHRGPNRQRHCRGGTLGIASLLAGTDATLNATGAVTLATATATTGDLASPRRTPASRRRP